MEEKEYYFKVKFFRYQSEANDVAVLTYAFLDTFKSDEDAAKYLAGWICDFGHIFGDELESAKIYVRDEETGDIELIGDLLLKVVDN